ncbi:hypothetical protein HZC30_02430 [Candidatus Woesearchaeota archaeon]|nr:hypothetical protein [Candidatus Woesearchaeota archaeon]
MVTIVGNLIVNGILALASLVYNPSPEACNEYGEYSPNGRNPNGRYHAVCESHYENGIADCERDELQRSVLSEKQSAMDECEQKYPSPSFSSAIFDCENNGSDCAGVPAYTPEGETQARRRKQCFDRVGKLFPSFYVADESSDSCSDRVSDEAHFCRQVKELKCDAISALESRL